MPYGLNAWVIVDSGELSMTRVLPVIAAPLELEPDPGLELELGLDEHAAIPPASTPAAATAKNRLWLCNLLISLVLLSGFSVVSHSAAASPPPRRPETSSGAATSRCQQA